MNRNIKAALLAVSLACIPFVASAHTQPLTLAGIEDDMGYPTADGRYHGGGYRMEMPMRMSRGYYVCYRSRAIIRNHMGDELVKYRGCMTSMSSCRSIGMNHFGRYNSQYQMEDAMDRCLSNQPRFVD